MTDSFDAIQREQILVYILILLWRLYLVSIMNTTNYDTESELMKFAAWNIQSNS